MRILSVYISRTIIMTTALVLAVLICMAFFILLIGEFGDIGKGTYGIVSALQFAALSLPQMVYQIFPMVGLVGVMLGLGLLSNHSELIVMRAAGVSIAKITLSVMVGVLLMVGSITLLGESLAPKLMRYGQIQKAIDKSGGQAVATQHGTWIRDKSSFIHIETVLGDKKLQDVTRYQFNPQRQLITVAKADEIDFTQGHWQAKTVKRSNLSNQGISASISHDEIWDINLNPTILKVAEIEPEEMSLLHLDTLIHYKKANGLNAASYQLAFWQRILQPLATCVMMFLAIPFIFGPMRSVTMGFRLLAGVIVGFSFYILNQFFGPISLVYQLPPILAAILPTLLFALVAYIMMQRVR